MRPREFAQVDVFSATPYAGNPVAVVLDGSDLDTSEMQRFAAWTNLSETTFVLPPQDPSANYRVRIFTPVAELPFAGHPTLGTCHAWLEASSVAASHGPWIQECGAGRVEVRQTAIGLAFAAPPLLRTGPVEEVLLADVAEALDIRRDEIVDSQWVDNGPGWMAVLLSEVDRLMAVQPAFRDLDLGVAALHPAGEPEAVEVRAFFPKDGVYVEDPVTGSLNASLADWLERSGRVRLPYVARQGTALGRAGRVHISRDGEGRLWIAGATRTFIRGETCL